MLTRTKRKSAIKQQTSFMHSLIGPRFSDYLILENLQLRFSQVKLVNFLLYCSNNKLNCGLSFLTSLGKTIINILYIDAIWFLDDLYHRSRKKFLILVPTVDLAYQFEKNLLFFRKFKNTDVAVLAKQNRKQRKSLYESDASIFISTSKGVLNDIYDSIITRMFFEILILDEVHHATGDDPYMKVAESLQTYVQIIGQTATSGDEEKRRRIAVQLDFENWDWRRPKPEEELSWLNPIDINLIDITLTDKINHQWSDWQIRFKEYYLLFKKELWQRLLKHNPKQTILKMNSSFLTFDHMQKLLNYILSKGKIGLAPRMLHSWSCLRITEEIMKRLFQEGYESGLRYYHQQRLEETGSAKRVFETLSALMTEIKLFSETVWHPKLTELLRILKQHDQEQVLIYLNHVEPIIDLHNQLKRLGISTSYLIGKAHSKLQSNKEAKQVIEDFLAGKIKKLLISPVGFEGMHFPNITVGVAYNIFLSPLKLMQASGRLGRTKIDDKLYFLCLGTHDRGQFFATRNGVNKLYAKIPYIPDRFSPLDPNLETCNLAYDKKDSWAKDLINNKVHMVRERFTVNEVRIYYDKKLKIYFALADKTGMANAVLYLDKNTSSAEIKNYKSLLGKVAIVSGKLRVQHFDYMNQSVATIHMVPYPDRQNISACPLNKVNPENFKPM